MRTTILFTTVAATAALIAAHPASAQERSFTGPRIEALAGYDTIDANAPAGVDGSVDGAHVRVQAGYDLPIGDTWRIGAEAGIGWQLGDGNDYEAGASRANVKSGHDLDLSLRVGAKVADRSFLYVKAGWANSGLRSRVTTGASTVTTRDDENGVRFGGGFEQMLTDRIYAKAEYRYTDYGHDVSRHQALLGVGYRF